MKNQNEGIPIRCDCGRVVAFVKDGKVYVKCRKCKREVEIPKVKDHQ